MSEEWPRFRLARFKKDDGSRYFGPYAHAGALRQTLNFMRKKFGVLTFGRGAPTERELKSSTYQLPVRLSEINAEQYRERVAQACDFLRGIRGNDIDTGKRNAKAAEKNGFREGAELQNMVNAFA
jgi:excinuclease ABC subunit C